MQGRSKSSPGEHARHLLLCALLLACGSGRSSVTGAGGGGAGTGGGAGGLDGGCAGTGGACIPSDSFVGQQCARPPGQPISFTTVDAMRAFARGRWALCEPPGLFGQSWPGLEIAADDQWNFLTDSGGGALVREYGVGVQGTVAYAQSASPGPVLLDFVDNLQQSTLATPTPSDNPRMLTLSTGTGAPIRYVALPSELPDGGSEGGDGPDADQPDAAGDGSRVTRCRTNADCVYFGSYCFIPASGASCPTTPIGYCLDGMVGHCFILQSPCSCNFYPGPVALDCSAFSDTMCGTVATDAGDGCLTCVPK